MEGHVTIHQCSHIGVAGTTAVHVKKLPDGTYEARVGIAIMGSTNMPWDDLKDANPFDDSFQDNFALGMGKTEEEALADMKADMNKTADSIWAI